MIKKTIREFYVLSALWKFSMSIICATYVIFLQEKGLNLFEVNMTNFAYFFALTVCEIPTGAFADVFGRKASFLMSCLILSLSMFIYFASETVTGFVLAEIIAAVGTTFATGAFQAWFVDKLHHHGYVGSMGPIFAKADQIKHGVGIIAALLGAFLAQLWLPLPWLIGGCSFLVCLLVALPLKEEYFVRQKVSFKAGYQAMKETTVSSLRYSRSNKKIRFIIIMVAIQVFAVQAANMQWQPLFQGWVENKTIFGFIWVGIALSSMLGAWLAPKILKWFRDEKKTLIFFQILIGVFIVTTVIVGWLPLVLITFLLHESARGAFEPIRSAYLHDNIPSRERATIESFSSLAYHGSGMLGLFISGILALRFGISWTWILMGGILIAVTSLYAKNGKGKH